MKKRMLYVCLALLLLLAALPLTASAADETKINEANFPDPIFRSYVSENFDLNGDSLLDADETAAVTSLDLSNTLVENLQGIKFFPLTSLDVNGCTKLYTLDCSYILSLISLDVSECTALQRLSCNDTQLTSLEVSGCTTLQNLGCRNTQLTALDVSRCTTLTFLDCNNNPLTELNVSGCTALQHLSSYNTQLTSLDISNCTALSYLNCHINQLTELDLYIKPDSLWLTCQITSLEIQKTSDGWAADLSKLVSTENLNKVQLREEQEWPYDTMKGQ